MSSADDRAAGAGAGTNAGAETGARTGGTGTGPGSCTCSGHHDAHTDEVIAGIIAEFSQVFAFARTRWSRYAEEVHAELRGVGMMILQTIIRRGSITATEISQLMDMDKSVISRQVAQLRELGLIEATPDEADRRVMRLSATTESAAITEALRSKTADAYHERFTDWSEEDLETLHQLLRRFNFAAPGGGGGDARS